MTQPPPRHRGSAQPSTRLPLAAPGGSQYPPGGGAAATDRSQALPSPRLYLAPSKAGLGPPRHLQESRGRDPGAHLPSGCVGAELYYLIAG